ncbi:hypothetical protein PR202_gb25685 [Eleusine coracana subsp. coracana]|uniref:Uncharacterized protein n=1 Tax=Eleusine coracana subsp. coracana TaxID=191504 RepID=A0AAV5FM32_ELECO|nr:hypothetical protein PR202_gb25685 [Eleusine coracana subsp. coracana]
MTVRPWSKLYWSGAHLYEGGRCRGGAFAAVTQADVPRPIFGWPRTKGKENGGCFTDAFNIPFPEICDASATPNAPASTSGSSPASPATDAQYMLDAMPERFYFSPSHF